MIPPVAVKLVEKTSIERALTGPGLKRVTLPSGTVRVGAGPGSGLEGRGAEVVVDEIGVVGAAAAADVSSVLIRVIMSG